MAFSRSLLFLSYLLFLIAFSSADDASHDGDSPKSPGCDRPFKLVKVMNWVNGVEGETLAGISARFGAILPSEAENALKLSAVFSNPLNCCSSSSSKLSGSIAMSIRGDCTFTTKAEVAESGGAEALLVINNEEELAEMGCNNDSVAPNISIPVVLVPKSGGEILNKSIVAGQKGEWWKMFGTVTPQLQFFAIKILSLTTSASGCERNWSIFEHIHSKKRNRLEHKKLQELVYIKYNQTLKARYDSKIAADPISLNDIDDSNEWLVGEIDNGDELVNGDASLAWKDVAIASGIGEERNTRRQATMGRLGTSSSRLGKEKEHVEEEETDDEQFDDFILDDKFTTCDAHSISGSEGDMMDME